MSDRLFIRRLTASVAVLLLAMAGLGSRLAFLHLGPHTSVRESFVRTRGMKRTILAGRGTICDRAGSRNILAVNLAVNDVCVDPKIVAQSNAVLEVASSLSETLGVASDVVAVRLGNPARRFEYVERFVHEERAREVQDLKLPGVFFRETMVRYYPHERFMCHVLGFVNHEGIGSGGVEQRADKFLRGAPGLVEGRVDARRREIYRERGRHIRPMEGASITLTLDQNIQHVVETALDDTVAKHNAKGAWAIVQHIRTGEILAMANRPCYDLNSFRTATDPDKLNRAIGYVYEPGSTFKAATIAAALNEGTVSPDTMFSCENGAWLYRKRILRDYSSYSRLNVADGLKKSSNILTAKVAVRLGDRLLHQYLRAFGIGHRLGIDLPGEEEGILHPVRKWSGISGSRIAIGQGVAVTGLQMLSVFSAIANDGQLMRPYVIKRVVSADGQEILLEREPEVVSRPISPATAATMRRLLARVTEPGGTGRRARVEGYRVAGKTGTAQKPVAGGYSSSAHMASFAGFLPAGDPEIAVIVVVDEPQPLHTGGVVAAPAFSRIAEAAVRCLAIPPEGGPSVAGL